MKNLMLKVILVLIAMVMGTSIALAAANPNCDQQAANTTQGILHQACDHANFAGCSSTSQKLNDSCNPTPGSTTFLQGILNTFLLAAGTVSLIFVLIGGFRYITSTGDSGRIKSAKDTLLYAIIGLIVTILAVPIAGFVVSKVTGG